MIPLILTAIAFGYDTKSKFEQFAFSMPIKKSSFVLSKSFFAFVFGLVGSVCLFVQLVIKRDVNRQHHIYLTNYISCKYFDISHSTSVYPKYGAEKGRLIMVIVYLQYLLLSSFLKQKSDLLS